MSPLARFACAVIAVALAAATTHSALARSPVMTAIVQAGSLDNSLSIVIANADPRSDVKGIAVRARSPVGPFIESVGIAPSRIDSLEPNAAREVTVRIDISENVPSEGARVTIRFDVTATEGMLDYSELTLHLGIETDEATFQIVPFVVGLTVAEAEAALRGSRLSVEVQRLDLPDNPDIFGLVAGQSLAAGTIVEAGTTVRLSAYPSQGIAVPDVVGLSVEEAARIVAAAGFATQLIPLGDAPSAEAAERVHRTAPEARTEAGAGAQVALFAYGAFRPPDPETDAPPAVTARGAWDQPWRGELKLAVFTADGRQMTLLEAMNIYGPKEEPETEEVPDEMLLFAMPEIVAGVADIGAGLVEAAVAVISFILESGVPLSITFVEDQDGFRLAVPGSGQIVDIVNGAGAAMPLLLPEGDKRLEASISHVDGTTEVSVRAAITAAADWSSLSVEIVVEARGLEGDNAPGSIGLILSGSLAPELYDADEYELDLLESLLTAVLKFLPDDFGQEAGFSKRQLEQLSREEFRSLLTSAYQMYTAR